MRSPDHAKWQPKNRADTERSASVLSPRRRRVLAIGCGIVILVGVLVAGTFGARAYAFEKWAVRDAEELRPYATVLYSANPARVQNGQLPTTATATMDDPDRTVLLENTRGRLAFHVSRSEYQRGWNGEGLWVKVYLETRHPSNPAVTKAVKVLNHLEETDGQWYVAETRALTIP